MGDYTQNQSFDWAGQTFFPRFMVTSLRKNLKGIQLECIQMHDFTNNDINPFAVYALSGSSWTDEQQGDCVDGFDSCGNCTDPPYLGPTCLDCYGTPNGNAYIDDCGSCVGGQSNVPPNWLMDCSGVCGGSATVDICGTCGGSVEEEVECGCPNPGDCLGCNNECMPCEMAAEYDCAGVCNGNHVLCEGGDCCPSSEQCDPECGTCGSIEEDYCGHSL